MNLQELIQQIPNFIGHMLKKKGRSEEDYEEMKDGTRVPKMFGMFHLGAQYDINIWLSNPSCGVFPC